MGLWVTQASDPEAGAGQIQFFALGRCAYFIEHWQQTGELATLIPYLVPYQSADHTSFTNYLKKLRTYLPSPLNQ